MSSRRWKAIAAVGLALAGCAPQQSTTTFVGPSGRPTHTAKCSQAPAGCFQEATRICTGPYQVLDSESHAGGALADIVPGPVTWYSITYTCGPSDGRMPAFNWRGPQYNAAPASAPVASGNPGDALIAAGAALAQPPAINPAFPTPVSCTSRRIGGAIQTNCM